MLSMKQFAQTSAISIAVFLTGCANQSDFAKSPLHAKQYDICIEGDDFTGKQSNFAGFKQSVMDCEAQGKFTKEQLSDKRLRRLDANENYRDYLFNADGVGVLVHEENIDLTIPFQWIVDKDGYLEVKFGNGWNWVVALIETEDQLHSVKIFEFPTDKDESFIWGAVFEEK